MKTTEQIQNCNPSNVIDPMNENTRLRAALVCARSQLVTLGGGRLAEGRRLGDDIQRAVLTEIDNALETHQ